MIPLCGARPLVATLHLTPGFIEAFKLWRLALADWREDCGPRAGSVAFGESSTDRAKLFERSTCP